MLLRTSSSPAPRSLAPATAPATGTAMGAGWRLVSPVGRVAPVLFGLGGLLLSLGLAPRASAWQATTAPSAQAALLLAPHPAQPA